MKEHPKRLKSRFRRIFAMARLGEPWGMAKIGLPMNKRKYSAKELVYISKLMARGMDKIRAEWYLNAMQTWSKEDYENYDKFHMEMMGPGPTEEDLEELRKMGVGI